MYCFVGGAVDDAGGRLDLSRPCDTMYGFSSARVSRGEQHSLWRLRKARMLDGYSCRRRC